MIVLTSKVISTLFVATILGVLLNHLLKQHIPIGLCEKVKIHNEVISP